MSQRQNNLRTLLLEVEIEVPITEGTLTPQESFDVVRDMVYEKINAGMTEVSVYHGIEWDIAIIVGL